MELVMQNLYLLIESILFNIPVLIAIVIIIKKRKDRRKSSRVPFKELQRRPAGEALRITLEDLDEKINEAIFWIVLIPVLATFLLFVQHPHDLTVPITLLILTSATTAFFGIRLWKLINSRANYQLGYDGERFVGEELSRLIGLGFEIYHDVPFGNFNIDHVLVGERGVFAVETKTKSKPVIHGKVEYRVAYDGEVLQWPWGKDSDDIKQTKSNAKDLANWLTSATGERVRATPILTLPGWMVERNELPVGLHILNAKEIYDVCSDLPPIIPDAQINRICHQLDQKCRIEVK